MNEQPAPVPAVFSPEAVASINRAYTAAVEILAAERLEERVIRDRLAEQMMHLARSGETDELRLCRLSLQAVLGRMPKLEGP